MNALIESISDYLQTSAFTALFLDAWLKSLAVLAVAGWPLFAVAAGSGGDPALDLVSGAGQPALLAVARRACRTPGKGRSGRSPPASTPATSSRSR